MIITNEWPTTGTLIDFGRDIHILYNEYGFLIEIKNSNGNAIIRKVDEDTAGVLNNTSFGKVSKLFAISFNGYSHIQPAFIRFKTDSVEMEIQVKYV